MPKKAKGDLHEDSPSLSKREQAECTLLKEAQEKAEQDKYEALKLASEL